jgi:hypothetical protein
MAGGAEAPRRLPVVEIADRAAFEGGGWRTTGFGDCATALAATDDPHAAPPDAGASPSVFALFTGGSLYFELRDPSPPKPWVLDVDYCWGDGKPTSCAAWHLAMDGSLVVEGPPRQGATGEWSSPRQQRRAEVSIVGPGVRRLHASAPAAFSDTPWDVRFGYHLIDEGRAARETAGAVLWIGTSGGGASSLRCVARDGVLHAEADGI